MFVCRKSEQGGRTFVETIAYIMVMIAITVSFAAAVSRGYYKYECSEVQQQLMDLKKSIANRYAADGHYNNVKWKDLCDDKIVPHSMMSKKMCERASAGTPAYGHHVFDGRVNIGKDDDGLTYYIEFLELPQDVCVQLGIISWSVNEGSDLDHMDINGKVWRWQYSPISEGEKYKELPAKVQDVSGVCEEGYDNTIKWFFS